MVQDNHLCKTFVGRDLDSDNRPMLCFECDKVLSQLREGDLKFDLHIPLIKLYWDRHKIFCNDEKKCFREMKRRYA